MYSHYFECFDYQLGCSFGKINLNYGDQAQGYIPLTYWFSCQAYYQLTTTILVNTQ